MNSGSLPPDLLESTLFGHVKGAFTSAVHTKKGYFEVANKGTIFFDEIGTIGPDTQAKLLRVIQEKEFTPLGSTDPVRVDVRILAATNADLRKLVEEGKFREDLYYRLNVINIAVAAAARPQGRYSGADAVTSSPSTAARTRSFWMARNNSMLTLRSRKRCRC